MKKIFIFCLLISAYIISPKNASAQYKSVFGKTSTSWTGFRYCSGVEISDSFHIAGDTVINSINYKKIMVEHMNNTNRLYGFIREDTLSGNIWFKYAEEDTKEKLIMTLNLQLGDSFSIYHYNVSPPYNIISDTVIVDSIYYMNGLKNIRFNAPLDCYLGELINFTFIEGIGPNAHFGYTGYKNGVDHALICYFKDSVKYYSFEGLHGKCSIFNTGIIEKLTGQLNNVKLYPNPTNGSGIVTCQNEKNACLNLEIYDLNGKRIFTNSSKTTYITFDINAFENGVYVYKLMNEKGESSSGRIMKQ
ncbi:MAG: T9SS type A sorting domain-containing protein [Bacteroidia bacterium]